MTGIITTNISGAGNEAGYGVAVQTDGKILVAGEADLDFAVVRYNANGSLDTTFSGDGIATADLKLNSSDAGIDHARSLAVQADGKILVAGYHVSGAYNANYDFALVRYNTDGSLDSSFDSDGKIITRVSGASNGTSYDLGYSVTVQADGKILMAGVTQTEYKYVDGLRYQTDFALVRYNSDGSLDTSFNNGGKAIINWGKKSNNMPFQDTGYSVAVQADGKILLAGESENESGHDFALIRINANGSSDTSFGGLITTNFGPVGSNFYDIGYSVTTQADGKILVAGTSNRGDNDGENSYDFALARYNANGSLDTSFDGDGKLTTNFGYNNTSSANGFQDMGYSVTVQADGKILVAGSTYGNLKSYFALARYNSNGSLDTSFDGDGRITTEIVGQSYGYSVAVQTDGKILVSGSSNSSTAFGVVRYNTDGSLDTSFNGASAQADNVAPLLASLTPGDNAVGVAVNSNLLLTFNESVKAGSGNLLIYNANGSIAKTIAVTDTTQVAFSGNTLTINPSSDLAAGSSYYVNMAAGVIQDSAGNNYAGISGKTAYNFKTVAAHWSAMTTNDLMAMTSSQWSAMATKDLNALTSAQWKTVATDDLQALTVAQWSAMTTDDLRSLSSAQWSAMATDDLSALTTAQWSAMATDDLRGLTSSQWAALASDELLALTSAQWSSMASDDLRGLTANQWAAIASDDLRSLSVLQWSAMATDDLLALTSAQWSAMATDDLRGLSSAQWSAMASDDLQSLTGAQWSSMASDDLRSLSSAQWSAMATDDLLALTTAQWSTLSSDDLSGLTAGQWSSMASDDLRSLTTAQWSAMATDDLSSLSNAQWSALAIDDLRGLTTAQWSSIATTSLHSLTTSQWSNMATDDLRGLTTEQWAAMNSDDLQALSSAQWSGMATDDLRSLMRDQWATLASIDLRALSSAQWTAMASDDLNSLSSAQWSAMELADLKALSSAQWSSLESADMMAISSATVTAILASSASKALSIGMLAANGGAGWWLSNGSYTPLMLDLNGDGVQTVNLANGVSFDLNADGLSERIGWISAQDGLLVRDLNRDNKINDGSELFGSATNLANGNKAKDGFQALRELDSNHDDVINAQDKTFSELKVWLDANQDGMSNAGELYSLDTLGITQLNVHANQTAVGNNGNWIGLESSYRTANGTNHALVDAWLQASNTAPQSIETNPMDYHAFIQEQMQLLLQSHIHTLLI